MATELERVLSNSAALEAAAKQIDAYVPFTAGNTLVMASAFADALRAAVAALPSPSPVGGELDDERFDALLDVGMEAIDGDLVASRTGGNGQREEFDLRETFGYALRAIVAVQPLGPPELNDDAIRAAWEKVSPRVPATPAMLWEFLQTIGDDSVSRRQVSGEDAVYCLDCMGPARPSCDHAGCGLVTLGELAELHSGPGVGDARETFDVEPLSDEERQGAIRAALDRASGRSVPSSVEEVCAPADRPSAEVSWTDQHGDHAHVLVGREQVQLYSPPTDDVLTDDVVAMISVRPSAGPHTFAVYVPRLAAQALLPALAAQVSPPGGVQDTPAGEGRRWTITVCPICDAQLHRQRPGDVPVCFGVGVEHERAVGVEQVVEPSPALPVQDKEGREGARYDELEVGGLLSSVNNVLEWIAHNPPDMDGDQQESLWALLDRWESMTGMQHDSHAELIDGRYEDHEEGQAAHG